MRPARAQANELRLGVLLPSSGALGQIADEHLRGLELAIEARSGSRPIRLLRAEAADPAQAQAETRRLIATDKTVAVFGTGNAGLAAAASQAAELAETPFIELGAVADALLDRGFRFTLRTSPGGGDLVRLAFETIAGPLAAAWGQPGKALRLAVLAEPGLAGQSLTTAAEAQAKARDWERPVLLTQPGRGSELGTLLARLRAEGTAILLHGGAPGDAAPLFRAMTETGWRPRMLLGLGATYSLAETAQTLGPLVDGMLVADVPPLAVSERAAPGRAAFLARYRARFGTTPRSGHSLAAFAGAEPILEQLARSGEPPRVALGALDLPEGALANGWGLRFDERGQNQRAWPALLQWQAGRLVTVAPSEAAVATLNPNLG
jgi:branched-chain amino acid transport system substrate-binding protein